MAYRVQISSLAEEDTVKSFEQIRDRVSAERAAEWLEGLLAAEFSLQEMPERCSIIPEADEIGVRIRHLLYGPRRAPFRIIFHVEEESVFILRVWPPHRDRLTIDDLEETETE